MNDRLNLDNASLLENPPPQEAFHFPFEKRKAADYILEKQHCSSTPEAFGSTFPFDTFASILSDDMYETLHPFNISKFQDVN